MKKIVVEFIVPDGAMDDLIITSKNDSTDGKKATPLQAFRDELQYWFYDEGGMDGWFNVESVESTDQTEGEWQTEKWGNK